MMLRRASLRGGLAALALAAGAAAPAAAHVTLQPSSGRPGDLVRYTAIVPNEERSDTVAVRMQVPEGADFALVEETAGWKARLIRTGGRIAELRWSGGRIPPDGFKAFSFIARNPVATGRVAWKVLQRYADGDVVRWIDEPGTDEPAPTVELAESARPESVVSVHGESASAEAAPAASTEGAEDDDGPGWAPLGIALGLGALGTALGGVGFVRARSRS